MSNLMGLLRVGASSLATQQTGIAVAGNNIANAQTTGYSRRSVLIEEGRGVVAGGGSITAGVTRAEDFVLSQQLSAQLFLERLDGAGKRRLRDVACLRRPCEVQALAHRQEIADLMHLHAATVADPAPIRQGVRWRPFPD